MGNSFGIPISGEEVRKRNLSDGEKVVVEIYKIDDFRKIAGILKTKISGQNFKNEVRKGWKN
ncbi:MAG: hypothetical protein AABW83_02220 [Nanoarchaeota archaeon]